MIPVTNRYEIIGEIIGVVIFHKIVFLDAPSIFAAS